VFVHILVCICMTDIAFAAVTTTLLTQSLLWA
jgi:hypothetical protein